MYSLPIGGLEAVRYEDILEEVGDLGEKSEEELNRLATIKKILEDRYDNYGILYYEPQDYQKKFHKDTKKERFVFGGNQTGKTESCVAEGIMIALGIHPEWKDRIPVPNRGRVVATDLSKGIGEVIGAKYDKLLPKSEIKKVSYYTGHERKKIILNNGSSIEFLSYEQDVKVFEGWTGHWAQFDEPMPRQIYIATYRGLMRYKGIMFGAMTPLNEPWIFDEIFSKAGVGKDKPSIYMFDIWDNKYLTKEEIQRFEDQLPDDEKEARMHGKFRHLSGLIYKEFGVEHKIQSFDIPKDWTRYCAMDYHPRTPCAILWLAINPHGIAYVYDELYIDKKLSDIAMAIMAKEEEHGVKPVRRLIDTLSSTPERESGLSSTRQLWRISKAMGYPILFRGATKHWVLGKNAVHEYLKIKRGKPGIYFFEDKVPKCINAMERYQWDDFAGVKSEKKGKKETPAKQYAHFPDTLRYLLVGKPKYRRVIPKEFADLVGTYGEQFDDDEMNVTGYSYGG